MVNLKMYSMYPKRSYSQIICSNQGLPKLVNHVYRDLIAHSDGRSNPTEEQQMLYVALIAYANRIVQCALRFGLCNNYDGVSFLKQAAFGIQLPEVLAEYIESLGVVDLPDGGSAKVIPWGANYEELFAGRHGQIAPDAVLSQAGRPDPGGPWHIDTQWIIDYSMTTQMYRHEHFRSVENSVFKGKPNILVFCKQINNKCKPQSQYFMHEREAQLGAVFQWRTHEQAATWPAETSMFAQPIYQGNEVEWMESFRNAFYN